MICKVLCVLALVATASAAPESRIVGGSPLQVSDAPYVVSIKYSYPGPGITIQRCVGSLISSWHVVTSAFCFLGANIQNMRVQAGSSHSLQGGVSRGVTHFLAHPQYSQQPRAFDVAVLFMEQPLAITPEVDVLFLPPVGYSVPVGAEVQVASWGFDAPGGSQLQNLHSITLNTIPQDQCQQAFANSEDVVIDDSVICAAAQGKNICGGDSGAPVVVSNMLVGVSSVESCGTDNPDVFLSVPSVSQWILSVALAPSSEDLTRVVV